MPEGAAPGIGGVFLRCQDPEALKSWYQQQLDLPAEESGVVVLRWREYERPERPGSTVVGFFPADTDYFGPRDVNAMINFRVADLDTTLERMRAAGTTVEGEIEESELGRFGHVTDPEGNRIELWEPAPDL